MSSVSEEQLIFKENRKILATDVDLHQNLRMSTLMKILQEISISHTEELGCTKKESLDRGLLWVVSRVRLEMKRPVKYDEQVRFETWPGKMQHVLFPRYYRAYSEDGEMILNGSAIWFLIEATGRNIVFPKQHGIEIPGISLEGEMELPEELRSLKAENFGESTADGENSAEGKSGKTGQYLRNVRYSDLDLNGHVNNTRYIDWIDDLHDPRWHENHIPKYFQINFKKEIRPQSAVRIQWEEDTGRNLLKTEGSVEGRVSFSAVETFL